MPEQTLEKLRAQRDALDKLIDEAQQLRAQINAHMRQFHERDLRVHPELPASTPKTGQQ